MVWEGIEPSTTALLAQRSTDWAIRPSYLLMNNIWFYHAETGIDCVFLYISEYKIQE